MTERTRQLLVTVAVLAVLIGVVILWIINTNQVRDCMALLNC